MKVILIQHVPKVGKKYEVKEVSNGFALNRLIPQGLALPATKSNIKKYENEKSQHDTDRLIQEELLEKSIEDLKGLKLQFKAKANEKGHLFAGIHENQIIEKIEQEVRLNVPISCIELKEVIKTVGEHEVIVQAGKTATKVAIEVIAEE